MGSEVIEQRDNVRRQGAEVVGEHKVSVSYHERMKIIFYNLGYARGIDGSPRMYRKYAGRFLHQSVKGQQRVLDEVATLVAAEQPDLFTFVELAEAKLRNRQFDQVAYLESRFKAAGVRGERALKYGSTIMQRLPFHTGNVNGYLAFTEVNDTYVRWLSVGSKRAVLELQLAGLTVFVVHLSLRRHKRQQQLREVAALVQQVPENVVVCGDFNIFHGMGELDELVTETRLRPAGADEPTFPSFSPAMQIDLFLYRFEDPSVVPHLRTIPASYSDHLPIILEW